nr:unnamed protein product [Spirometra erinaceieuropaei]
MTYHLSESFGTAEFLSSFSQSFAIRRVEGLRQIHEGRVEVDPHLLAFFLQFMSGEDHVGGSTITAKAALTFRQETQFQMAVQAIEKNASEDLPDDFQRGYASVAVANLAVDFPLVETDDLDFLEILRNVFLTPHLPEESRKMSSRARRYQQAQAVVDAPWQTGQSFDDVVSGDKGDARLQSLCPGTTALAGTNILHLALFGETGLDSSGRRTCLPFSHSEAGNSTGVSTYAKTEEFGVSSCGSGCGLFRSMEFLWNPSQQSVGDYPSGNQSTEKWMRTSWKQHPCYAEAGVDGSECSFLKYLSEVEDFCPPIDSRRPMPYENITTISQLNLSFSGASALFNRQSNLAASVKFMRDRMARLWPAWTDGVHQYPVLLAQRGLSPNISLTGGPKLKILVYMGFLQMPGFDSGLSKGGPQGEYVQWTDLISALFILGHELTVAMTPSDLTSVYELKNPVLQDCVTADRRFDLVFTDIIGYRHILQQLSKFSRK